MLCFVLDKKSVFADITKDTPEICRAEFQTPKLVSSHGHFESHGWVDLLRLEDCNMVQGYYTWPQLDHGALYTQILRHLLSELGWSWLRLLYTWKKEINNGDDADNNNFFSSTSFYFTCLIWNTSDKTLSCWNTSTKSLKGKNMN